MIYAAKATRYDGTDMYGQVVDDPPTVSIEADDVIPCPGCCGDIYDDVDGAQGGHEDGCEYTGQRLYPPPFNHAGVQVVSDDEVLVWISVGDPRGALHWTLRRTSDGDVLLHAPYPGDGRPHVRLTELHPGTYQIGG